MATREESTLWDWLEEATEAPTAIALTEVWTYLDQAIQGLPIDQQLQIAARTIAKVAELLGVRAEEMLKEWEDCNSPEGPSMGIDVFAGLVRMSMQLDLDDLKAPVEPQSFKKHKSHKKSEPIAPDDSVVGVVEKEKILAMAEEVMTIEKLRHLAGEEDIQTWQSAIANYLAQTDQKIRLIDLQQALQMPLVEVWLGLLLGGYALEQRGDFYNTRQVWVIHS